MTHAYIHTQCYGSWCRASNRALSLAGPCGPRVPGHAATIVESLGFPADRVTMLTRRFGKEGGTEVDPKSSSFRFKRFLA